jgi:hypothetical protein
MCAWEGDLHQGERIAGEIQSLMTSSSDFNFVPIRGHLCSDRTKKFKEKRRGRRTPNKQTMAKDENWLYLEERKAGVKAALAREGQPPQEEPPVGLRLRKVSLHTHTHTPSHCKSPPHPQCPSLVFLIFLGEYSLPFFCFLSLSLFLLSPSGVFSS